MVIDVEILSLKFLITIFDTGIVFLLVSFPDFLSNFIFNLIKDLEFLNLEWCKFFVWEGWQFFLAKFNFKITKSLSCILSLSLGKVIKIINLNLLLFDNDRQFIHDEFLIFKSIDNIQNVIKYSLEWFEGVQMESSFNCAHEIKI